MKILEWELQGPEEWREIATHPGYEVSNRGRVRSFRRHANGRVLRPGNNSKGYPCVVLYHGTKKSAKSYLVHRLVVAAFLGTIPANRTVNHKDGDKENNSIDNLELVTHLENNMHARSLGLNPGKPSKLTEAEVLSLLRSTQGVPKAIRWKLEREFTQQYGLNRDYVRQLVRGDQRRDLYERVQAESLGST